MRLVPTRFHAAALLAALAPLTAALPTHAANLGVALQDVRASTGQIKLAVVDASGWDGGAAPVRAVAMAPQGDTATLSFSGLTPGRYAVMVTHDENGNGRLDSNLIGMPVEGYGFSNNPRVMRKPTFDEASFEVGDADLAITIQLR